MSAANLDLTQVVITSNDCTSVDDVVPTHVDWQGWWMSEQQYSDGVIRVPSQITGVNRFLAFAEMGGWCKMVLFEIARDSTNNQCSYKPLAARYKAGCDTNAEYCSFLDANGWCAPLTGNGEAGYGIEELFFSYKTGTIVDADQCSVNWNPNDACISLLNLSDPDQSDDSDVPSVTPSDIPSDVPSGVPSDVPSDVPSGK